MLTWHVTVFQDMHVSGKQNKSAYFRPAAMKHDDFIEMMQEIVPKLAESFPQGMKRPGEQTETKHS